MEYGFIIRVLKNMNKKARGFEWRYVKKPETSLAQNLKIWEITQGLVYSYFSREKNERFHGVWLYRSCRGETDASFTQCSSRTLFKNLKLWFEILKV